MTVGSPVKQIILFTIPMLIGNFAQQLYSTVDSIVVGRFVGDNALAAVGTTGPLINLMIALFIGISVGASIMVSQYFGARKREELSRSIGCCITLTAFASLFITVVGVLIARPVLLLLNVPASILDWSTTYIRILFIGFAGMGYY
ncbi:MAG: MATE family efflux transporter, partial [Clostridia bacterium]|nr:MATE family efflux transporter [Clostridia bacterium]